MFIRRVIGSCLLVALSAVAASAADSEVADAAMKGNGDAVRALLLRKADVNAPQIDGATALHWAVRGDDVELTDLLLRAGANASAATREGVTPMQIAAMNGNAAILVRLIKAGADPNAPLSQYHDTALMMAARTGKTDALRSLLESGADGQRHGDLGRHDGADVGGVRAPSGRGQGAARQRRRGQRPLQVRAGGQRPRLRRAGAVGHAAGQGHRGVRQRLADRR